MPYFTWGGSAGGSWFVIVAKDPEFHNVVDYAWTQVRAYAPRDGANPITYPDETTAYYWAVLPASGFNGTGAVGDPLVRLAGAVQQAVDTAASCSHPRLGREPTARRSSAGPRSTAPAATTCRSHGRTTSAR